MKRYEYLIVTGTNYETDGNMTWIEGVVNGEKMFDGEKMPIDKLLNRLGGDGWKLVHAVGAFEIQGNAMIFEREKHEDE